MTEKERLVSMGFSEDLAAQALSATGGSSPTKAVEWILNHKTIPSSNDSSFAPPIQPKLHRFFNSKPDDAPSSTPIQDDLLPLSKRLKSTLTHATTATATATTNTTPPPLLTSPSTTECALAPSTTSSAKTTYSPPTPSFAPPSTATDVRDAIDEARRSKTKNKRIVLFVEEVHRFNKAQQDSFLPIIEDGSIVFIGATTENPSFHIITPLLSRCTTLVLHALEPNHSAQLLRWAADDSRVGLTASIGMRPVQVEDDVIHFVSANCDGDARVALNALEISATTAASRAALQL
ncbi:hypothetical protein G4B88_015293, partial [Cannabis sativa]